MIGLFTSRKRARFVFAVPKTEDLEKIADLVEKGKVKTVIDQVFTLDDLEAAHQLSQTGRVRGKLVIQII